MMQAGDRVKALVIKVDREKGRITLSIKRLEKEPGDFFRFSREAFWQQAEEQAAAYRQSTAGTHQ
jgi:small subunit ribosomal protein S1